MTTTTLLTFRVRAPIGTRSVNLLGSWDNFTTSYAMQRDTRTGPEHWTGCHTFSNIICDGDLQTPNQSRDGGLKMGGTYWYYYKLDDDIEIHDSAEPSTASCPMLPGQLVNVLHVPIALSGARTRSASTSSELRTLNPSDKYMNPRAVPRPALNRIQTSPMPPAQPWTSNTDTDPVSACSVSERPESSGQDGLSSTLTTSFRLFRLPRKAPGSSSRSDSPNLAKSSRSDSPSLAKPTGFRNPFRVFNKSPRSTSPDSVREDQKPTSDGNSGLESQDLMPDEAIYSTLEVRGRTAPTLEVPANFSSELDVALQRLMGQTPDSSVGLVNMSFHRHRAGISRSRSRDPTPLRRSLGPDDHYTDSEPQTLDTLAEVPSTVPTPACPDLIMQLPTHTNVNLEKRLPTLPNTPSSAYPPSPTEEAPNHVDLSGQQLRSHFSVSTIASDFHSSFFTGVNKSHFSAWTEDGSSIGIPRSREASFSHDQNSPINATFPPHELVDSSQAIIDDNNIAVQEIPAISNDAQISLSTSFNNSMAGSLVSRSPASSVYDIPDLLPARPIDKKREGKSSWTTFEHYRLPADEYMSETTLKRFNPHTSSQDLFHEEAIQERQVTSSKHHSTHLSHSDSMQELLDELRYLTQMIHH